MLNLRQLNSAQDQDSDEGRFSLFSHPIFRYNSAIIGNIGEPLQHGQLDRYILDEDDPPSDAGTRVPDSLITTAVYAEVVEPVADPSGILPDEPGDIGQAPSSRSALHRHIA